MCAGFFLDVFTIIPWDLLFAAVANAARWRMDAPSKTGRRLLWALRQMFWWTPSRSAENLRPQTAQGSSPPGAAAVENAVVSAGGSQRFVRDAGRGTFGLNCVRKAAAAAWRGESCCAGPDQEERAGRAREMGSESARAAFAVSPFHERRWSAALRGALHFSRCSSSSPCKIGLSPARIRHRDDAAAMACLREIEESGDQSTKIPGTPRRTARAGHLDGRPLALALGQVDLQAVGEVALAADGAAHVVGHRLRPPRRGPGVRGRSRGRNRALLVCVC